MGPEPSWTVAPKGVPDWLAGVLSGIGVPAWLAGPAKAVLMTLAERNPGLQAVMSVAMSMADAKGIRIPLWSEADMRKQLARIPKGQEILSNLPPNTNFKAYVKDVKDVRGAYYLNGTIHIPTSYTSIQAAVLVAHEAVHADQQVHRGPPRDLNDDVEREVEATNAGLDVYDQLSHPPMPAGDSTPEDWVSRQRDPRAFDDEVRHVYRRLYEDRYRDREVPDGK